MREPGAGRRSATAGANVVDLVHALKKGIASEAP
jgi:hypothetical protein